MTEQTPTPPGARIRDLLIEDEMRESYLKYAMSVIVSRALPDVRDGLKPSQRRILVAMNDLGLNPRAKFRKCAKIAGDTSGNYHPHGESVVYPTLVRMAQDFNMRAQLIQPQGNFGTPDDPPAAMRYTEARLDYPAMELLADLSEDTVDFIPNYDESRYEPTVLPGKFPNLLVNGSQGIAVGMASSIPPHNLREVCNAVIALIADPEITLDDLMVHVPGPDFPKGAWICGQESIRQAYETGRSKLKLRARYHVEERGSDRASLVFTELPYGVSIKGVSDEIVALINAKKLTSISDVRDESSLADGLRLVVDLKRGEIERIVANHLYKHTRLQDTFSVINIALVKGRPETLPLKRMLEEFRDHRIVVIRRRTRFRLAKAEARAHIVEGLINALDVIDQVIALIRASHTSAEARVALMEGVETTAEAQSRGLPAIVRFSELQAQAILDMRLARLTGLEREKLQAEWDELQLVIADLMDILERRERVLAIICDDLRELAEKYGNDRRSEITVDPSEVRMEDLIADEPVAVTISHAGYVKRIAVSEYRLQTRGGKGVTGGDTKKDDFIETIRIATNHEYLLVLTQKGQLYWLRVFDIPEGSRTSRGRALVNLLQVSGEDRIEACVSVRTFDSGYLLTVTAQGIVRKTPLSNFSRPRINGIIGVKIREGDRLIGAREIEDGDHVMLATKRGLAIRFRESDVRAMGRTSAGVRGIKLRKDDEVVSLVVVKPSEAAEAPEGEETDGPRNETSILTVCQNGFGKRTNADEYRVQGRSGMGLINIKVSDRNGDVVGVRAVSDEDEFMMITRKGMVVRTRVSDCREIGRNTQGVTLMHVKEGDVIQSVALLGERDEDEEDAEGLEGAEAAEDGGDGSPAEEAGENGDGDGAPAEEA